MGHIEKISFKGHSGAELSARLDRPAGPIKAYAIFAHCFTCSKDIVAARRIAAALSRDNIAVLRFDFTGLGASEGEFASTNFSSNVADLVLAADFLRENYQAPALLIGHSLGGAAILAAAPSIEEAKAVVTIAAPSDADHVAKNFGSDIKEIENKGSASVKLAGRTFTIEKQFLDDIRSTTFKDRIGSLNKALLIFHSPVDETVGIDNATAIFQAARHPKSFVSLDGADHLLTSESAASFVAEVISAWSGRYLPSQPPIDGETGDQEAGDQSGVIVAETGEGKFQNTVRAGAHGFYADEPVSYGGLDSGPSPYDLLSASLGACTSMTLRMYADHKKLALGPISVAVSHEKVHAADCADCSQERQDKGGKIDVFVRKISIDGDLDPALAGKLEEIANKCPVHRTLESGARIRTEIL